MRSRTFGLSCKKRFFFPFYPSYVKRGLIFLPLVRGCNLTQEIFRLFRNISPIISFWTFFTALQEPQFHSSVWRYREHLQKTPGISFTAGKTIQNFCFCGLIRNRSTLGQNYLFVCFFVVFFQFEPSPLVSPPFSTLLPLFFPSSKFQWPEYSGTSRKRPPSLTQALGGWGRAKEKEIEGRTRASP